MQGIFSLPHLINNLAKFYTQSYFPQYFMMMMILLCFSFILFSFASAVLSER
jgi:hypothetical protein